MIIKNKIIFNLGIFALIVVLIMVMLIFNKYIKMDENIKSNVENFESTSTQAAESTITKEAESTTTKAAESTTTKAAESTTTKAAESTTTKAAESTTTKAAGTTTTKAAVTATTIPITTHGYKLSKTTDKNPQTNLFQQNFDGTSNVYAPYIYHNMESFTPLNSYDDKLSEY
jgi:cytoskeletal protein RodZ